METPHNCLQMTRLATAAAEGTELTDVLPRTKDQLTEGLDAGPTEQRDQPVGQLLGAPGAAIGKAGRDVVRGSRRAGGTA